MRSSNILLMILLACGTALSANNAPDFSRAKDIAVHGASVKKESSSYLLRIDDPGWNAGLKLLPPDGGKYWDLSAGDILAADIENLSRKKQMRLNMAVTSGEKKSRRENVTGIALNPGEKRTIRLHIPGIFRSPMPKGVPSPRLCDRTKINDISFFLQWPFEAPEKGLANCRISNLRLEKSPLFGKALPNEKNFFPFIDRYGQFVHADWPGKVRSDADIRKSLEQEKLELASVERPKEWNRFGGWKNGPKLKATGFFRVEKYRGKWYFVDPEGALFFSHGIDVLIAQTDSTATRGHEKWFASEKRPLPQRMAFSEEALKIRFGQENFQSSFYKFLVRRLEAWGINTIGNWGKSEIMLLGKTPYTLQLADHNSKLPKIAGSKLKFYDVFDPVYVRSMTTLLSRRAAEDEITAKSIRDPMCIGYFIDNELNFGNRKPRELFNSVLKSPKTQEAKKILVSDLKKKYGTVDALNKAWKSSFESWNAILESRNFVPGRNNDVNTDANAFLKKTVERYFSLCREGIKSVAPHRLYLGTRFISTDGVRKELYEASKKYCDVLSVNIYAHSCANFGNSKSFPDMPVLVGEFHFGIYDRLFATSLCAAGATQKERAEAYARFLEGALANEKIVGAHHFQYRDQPLTGRWDGEGYPIGFVDVTDAPYSELTKTARKIGENMYLLRRNGGSVK